MIHTGVILACDDGRERSSQCRPGWNGWLILRLRCHRWSRKARSRLRGSWLTDGTPGWKACEVSGLSVRRSAGPRRGRASRREMDGCKRTSWNKADISIIWFISCHSFYSGTLHPPLADTQTKQPWCLFSGSLIHQKSHVATCHTRFSSYFRDTCVEILQNKTKKQKQKNNLIFCPYFKMTTYSDRVTDWPLIVLEGCVNSKWPLWLFSVLLENTAACWAKMTITHPVDWAGALWGSS